MNQSNDMSEVQYGTRFKLLDKYLDIMTDQNPYVPRLHKKKKHSPRSLFSEWSSPPSSSSSESSESQEGDHVPSPQAPTSTHNRHNDETIPPPQTSVRTNPQKPNPRPISKSQRTKFRRVEQWVFDVEAQTPRQPLLAFHDHDLSLYRTFDEQKQPWPFPRPDSLSDAATNESRNSSLDRALARIRRHIRTQWIEVASFGCWWVRVVVAVFLFLVLAVGLFEVKEIWEFHARGEEDADAEAVVFWKRLVEVGE